MSLLYPDPVYRGEGGEASAVVVPAGGPVDIDAMPRSTCTQGASREPMLCCAAP